MAKKKGGSTGTAAAVNFFGLVLGVDLREPGLKVPGFGRLGQRGLWHVEAAAAASKRNSQGALTP